MILVIFDADFPPAGLTAKWSRQPVGLFRLARQVAVLVAGAS